MEGDAFDAPNCLAAEDPRRAERTGLPVYRRVRVGDDRLASTKILGRGNRAALRRRSRWGRTGGRDTHAVGAPWGASARAVARARLGGTRLPQLEQLGGRRGSWACRPDQYPQ